jgi:hypothetical protein
MLWTGLNGDWFCATGCGKPVGLVSREELDPNNPKYVDWHFQCLFCGHEMWEEHNRELEDDEDETLFRM